MFVTNWISTTKIQKISEITNFFRHYFLSRTEVKLFEYLRKIRKNLADEQGYPPYIVLSDKSLHELTKMKPTTLQAFGLISGIGEFKIKKYGDTFIKAIKKYTGK